MMRILSLFLILLLAGACTDYTSPEEKALAEKAKKEILQEEADHAIKMEEARIALEDSIRAMMDTIPVIQ